MTDGQLYQRQIHGEGDEDGDAPRWPSDKKTATPEIFGAPSRLSITKREPSLRIGELLLAMDFD